jgi:hypothetical protein
MMGPWLFVMSRWVYSRRGRWSPLHFHLPSASNSSLHFTIACSMHTSNMQQHNTTQKKTKKKLHSSPSHVHQVPAMPSPLPAPPPPPLPQISPHINLQPQKSNKSCIHWLIPCAHRLRSCKWPQQIAKLAKLPHRFPELWMCRQIAGFWEFVEDGRKFGGKDSILISMCFRCWLWNFQLQVD